MKRIFYIVLSMVFFCSCSVKKNERYYQDRWCKARGGKVEARLSDRTRCDCLTKTYAVEFDWAGKWEAVEQALHYGRLTGKKPGIVFICRTPKDRKKIKRAINMVGINIR